jgi:hypothetical protein
VYISPSRVERRLVGQRLRKFNWFFAIQDDTVCCILYFNVTSYFLLLFTFIEDCAIYFEGNGSIHDLPQITVAGRRFPQGTILGVFKGLNLAFWWKV